MLTVAHINDTFSNYFFLYFFLNLDNLKIILNPYKFNLLAKTAYLLKKDQILSHNNQAVNELTSANEVDPGIFKQNMNGVFNL